MARLVPNSFSVYALDDAEAESGTVLTYMQKAVIQNKISFAAETKLNLIFDPKDPADFGIQTSYQTGRIDALKELLLSSEEMESILITRAPQSQE